jgi:biopolymer transport protein TolR
MGMQVGNKKGGAMADINVTPLVDVVLVLLIIFMVVTQMLASGVQVKLPNAKSTSSVQDMGQHLVISIRPPSKEKSDPRVYVDRKQSDLDNLIVDINDAYKSGPSRSLLIKGSKTLKWKEAYIVMSNISGGGMTTMLLATEKAKE